MIFRRAVAFYIDVIIRGFIGILLFLIIFIYSKVLTAKLNFNYINLFIIIVMSFGGFYIDYLICKYNGGFTTGDALLHIRIKSKKYNKNKFYLLRFILRSVTIYIPIFLIYNFASMFIRKRYNYIWYDDFLGLYCEKNNKNKLL